MKGNCASLSKFLQKYKTFDCLTSSFIIDCEKKIFKTGFNKVSCTSTNGAANFILRRNFNSAISQQTCKKNYKHIISHKISGDPTFTSFILWHWTRRMPVRRGKKLFVGTWRYIGAPSQRMEFNHSLYTCKWIVKSSKRSCLQLQSFFIPFMQHRSTSESRPDDITSVMDQK